MDMGDVGGDVVLGSSVHIAVEEERERTRKPFTAEEVRLLEQLQEENGDELLQRRAVVDAARPEDSPLHGRFTWDDSVAGEKYRLIEAGRVIKAVILSDDARPEMKAPMWVSLGADRVKPGGGYRPLRQVLRDEDLKREMLRTAYAELKSFRKRYDDLKELAGVMRAIDRTVPKEE